MKNMPNKIIEAKELEKMSAGSYEERLSLLSAHLEENNDDFGGSVAVIATFPSKVIVMNESGIFYSVGYGIDNRNRVSYDEIEELHVPVMTEEDMTTRSIDHFSEDSSLKDLMSNMIFRKFSERKAEKSPMEITVESLDMISSVGAPWIGYIEENRIALSKEAFDPKYGSPKIEVSSKFNSLIESDEELDNDDVESVMIALSKLEGRISRMHEIVSESVDKYSEAVASGSDQEADQLLERFDDFCSNFIEYVEMVGGFVSESISRIGSGYAKCGALAHDAIADRIVDMELASRLIRKVSAEFVQ